MQEDAIIASSPSFPTVFYKQLLASRPQYRYRACRPNLKYVPVGVPLIRYPLSGFSSALIDRFDTWAQKIGSAVQMLAEAY